MENKSAAITAIDSINLQFIPSIEEYNTLRQELIARIGIINSQSHTAILTILTVWGSGFALLSGVPKAFENVEFFSPLPLILLACFIYLVPVFYFLPLSIKSGENIKQIASISSYIKAFHEQYSVENGRKLFNWESSCEKIGDMNEGWNVSDHFTFLYNIEYTVLAFSSLVIYSAISTGLLLGYISQYLSGYRTMCLVIFITMFIIGLFCCAFIFIFSNVKRTIDREKDTFYKEYLDRASKFNLISQDQIGNMYMDN